MLCKHRCPLFDESIGVTPRRSIGIDVLHTLFLGPMLSWGKVAVWAMLTAGVWGQLESSVEQQLKVALLALRAFLIKWYADQQADGLLHTRINYITLKMVGSANDPCLKLKAMEAYGFLQFLCHCLSQYHHVVDRAPVLLAAGTSIHDLVQLMKTSPANPSLRVRQEPSW